jgi:DNA ligase-1
VERFGRLYRDVDAARTGAAKLAALADYLAAAPADDAAWAFSLLVRPPARSMSTAALRDAAMHAAGLSRWLFDASHAVVGDVAETAALVVPPARAATRESLAWWMRERVLPMRDLAPDARAGRLREDWDVLDGDARLVYTKLVAGTFRPGVPHRLLARALAQAAGVDAALVTLRLAEVRTGKRAPDAAAFVALTTPLATGEDDARSRPYPFAVAPPLATPADLGPPAAWLVEWQWPGTRAQIVRRGARTYVWSDEGELVGASVPDVERAAARLPDGTVLDGVLAAGANLPALLAAEGVDTLFVACDLLQWRGDDLREAPLVERVAALRALLNEVGERTLRASPPVHAASWDDYAVLLAQARGRGAAGLLVRHREGRHGTPTGHAFAWTPEPLRIAAVLVYAEPGTPKGFDLATYTLAVWDARGATRSLAPIAKVTAALSEAERREIEAIVRRTTVERFGPVRRVAPTLVLELAFDAIEPSARHKAGLVLRAPRIVRRVDSPVEDAATLDALRALLAATHGA